MRAASDTTTSTDRAVCWLRLLLLRLLLAAAPTAASVTAVAAILCRHPGRYY
jgi:hypothetical protein